MDVDSPKTMLTIQANIQLRHTNTDSMGIFLTTVSPNKHVSPVEMRKHLIKERDKCIRHNQTNILCLCLWLRRSVIVTEMV